MSLDFAELAAEQSRLNNKGNTDWKKRYVNMPAGEGSVFVRLLPPAQGKPWYVATRYHKLGMKNFYSMLEYKGGKWEGTCPINEEYRKLWKEIERLEKNKRMDAAAELRDMARRMGPIKKYHYACIVRSEIVDGKEVVNSGPKILSVGEELHTKIIDSVLGKPNLKIRGLGDVTAFETDRDGVRTGRDFQIIKRLKPGKDAFPDYSQSMFVEPSVAGTKDEWDKWLANIPDLAAERRIKPLAEIQEGLDIFFGRKAEPTVQVGPVAFVEKKSTQEAPKIVKPVIQDVLTNEDDALEADDDFLSALRNV